MIKQSVKKPFTVLVAVIMVLVLGFVSLTSMTMDLLPPISLPYLMVITTYPGASSEKVEADVTIPLENALGTITGVTNVYSTSAENYGMVQLEFEDGTDMDSAMVKVSSALQETVPSLPELCGTPSIMELSMDMMATMYVAVSQEGSDIYELSDLAEAELIPYIQRQSGVASVGAIGVVEKSVQVELDKDKIDDLNTKLLAAADEKLADAQQELEDAEQQMADGKAELEKQQASFGETMSGQIFGALEEPVTEMAENLHDQLGELLPKVEELRKQVNNSGISASLREAINGLQDAMDSLQDADDLVSAVIRIDALLDALMEDLDLIQPSLEGVWNAADIQNTILEIYAIINTMDGSNTDAVIEQLAQTGTARFETLETAVNALSQTVRDAELRAQLEALAKELSGIIEDISGSLEGSGSQAAPQQINLKSLQDALRELQAILADLRDVLKDLRASDPEAQLEKAVANVYTALVDVQDLLTKAPDLLESLETMFAQLTQGQLDAAVGFSSALMQLTLAEQQLTQAREQFDTARETALESANLDTLLNLETLSQVIYAHNFAMPAGYIDDEDDNSWLLKVGDELASVEDLSQTLLVNVDGIGDVRLQDVATITVIDNSEDSYAKVNGEESVVLSIFKSSTAGTNTVSKNCQEAFSELEAEYDGLRVDTLMNQGDYITIIVDSVLSSIILGAILAILVLALFLKDVKPTLVVAVSIPLSVLFALVLMYFTGLTLNMITLSGLALGIGMLVDNSVVVLENIYRLRGRGVSAPRAAVQGARQVSGSIIASTLTTVCVFLPMVFSTGTVRELLVPMGLSITYCLMASLIVAETVVPAASSSLLRNSVPKEHPWFDKALNVYERLLNWCLDHRLATIAVAAALLIVTVIQVFRTGIVILPSMTAEQISVTITTSEDLDRTTSYETVDEVMDRILELEGVSTVGIMDTGSTTGMISSAMASSGGSYGTYIGYVMSDDSLGSGGVTALCDAINAAAEGLDCTISASADGMGDMSALMASGLSISIYGDDLDTITAVSEDIIEIVESVDGFENASNGLEDLPASRHLAINRDEAARAGFTTAQIYMELASQLTSSAVATTITADGDTMEVTITDTTALPTLEELLDLELTGTSMDENGQPVETVYLLGDFAVIEESPAVGSISRENQNTYLTVTADTAEGMNTTLLSRTLQDKLDAYEAEGNLPKGVSVVMAGETSEVNDMVWQMLKMILLALLFVYLVMVAQFQSLLSPFIVLFTVPLAFTGGMLGLMLFGEQLSLLSLMGFLVLMGTVVNNGIVFVDYANQLRMGGMERRDALIATGRTRMRPILMSTLTTVLAMGQLIFGDDMGSQLGGGMAIVIAGGLTYATLMTLFVIPVMYDILFRRPPLNVDLGSEDLDDVPDDAAEFLAEKALREAAKAEGPAAMTP